jgi:MFS family permease
MMERSDSSMGATGSHWARALGADSAGAHEFNRVCVSFFLDCLSLGACLSVLSAFGELLRSKGTIGTPAFVSFGLVLVLAPWCLGPAWRALAQRSGRRATCVLSGVCQSLGVACVAFAPGLPSLLLASTLWSVSAGGVVVSTSAVAELLPRERGPVGFGVLLAAVALGLGVGLHLGSFTGAQDPRLALWICAWLTAAGMTHALARPPRLQP